MIPVETVLANVPIRIRDLDIALALHACLAEEEHGPIMQIAAYIDAISFQTGILKSAGVSHEVLPILAENLRKLAAHLDLLTAPKERH